MTSHTMTADQITLVTRPGSLARLRERAALGLGWVAYGLFYATVLASVLGAPIALGFYLAGLRPD